jgi:radical SAM superfamily enzyme YgiQ (UPF0313 family)
MLRDADEGAPAPLRWNVAGIVESQTMKVLMVYTNTYRKFAAAPIGASLVASRLRGDGHEVRFLDLMFAESPAAEAAQWAKEFKPDLICYSMRNVDSQSTEDFFDPLPTIQSIVSTVRTVRPAPTLLGGTAFTTFPAQLLEALEADYGFAGDDLVSISRFVTSLAAGQPDRSVPGLVFRDVEGIRRNPSTICGYADTAFDNWDLLDLRAYQESDETDVDCGLVARTGCPFECVYCDYHTTFGRRYILRDPRRVAEEALEVQRLGGRSVMFADAGFNRPLDHAKEVLQALLTAGVSLNLFAVFEPGEIDQEFVALYRRAGGLGVLLYTDSLSDEVLVRTRRPFLADDAVRAGSMFREAGVACALPLTFGGPGETPDTVEETMRIASIIGPARTVTGHGYRIQAGTPLREIAIEEGVIGPDDDCFRATFYHSPATPPEMLEARLKRDGD